jgi:antitoxin component YwqK of YwqJK toxin-antitoxin module
MAKMKFPEKKVEKVMHEYKEGELHSGSKEGPEVTNPKQAIAIALSEADKGKKMAEGGDIINPGDDMEVDPGSFPENYKNKENWESGTVGEGPLKVYHRNKQLYEHTHYQNGMRHGETKQWGPNGRLTAHAYFQNGLPIGESKQWYTNGKPIEDAHIYYDEQTGENVPLPNNIQAGHILANGKHYPSAGYATNKAVEDETHFEEKNRTAAQHIAEVGTEEKKNIQPPLEKN